MARNNKIDLPSSGGGLTRNFGSSGSKLKIAPEYMVIGIVVVVVLFVAFGVVMR